MTILNVGSINWDRVFQVPHFPQPGETLSSSKARKGLGGKGLNQSIAIIRSGGSVRHFGAIGAGDGAIQQALQQEGINLDLITECADVETGTAIIFVDREGENLIVLDPGANAQLDTEAVCDAMSNLGPDDWALFQNETNILGQGMEIARASGVKTALAAAPFDAEAILPLLPMVNFLALNEIELGQLISAGGQDILPEDISVLVTMGEKGAELRHDGQIVQRPSVPTQVVDTTGAGDTVLGAFLARLDLGEAPGQALDYALHAAAIQISRPGAAGAIPQESEVRALMAG